jgi:hypothetical protein
MPGWGFPGNSRKAHYFGTDGMALCHRWGLFRGSLDDTNHESPENCAECKRRRKRSVAVLAPAGDRRPGEG